MLALVLLLSMAAIRTSYWSNIPSNMTITVIMVIPIVVKENIGGTKTEKGHILTRNRTL